MNILVTGGTGFIGTRLALACVERGHDCTVYAQINNDAEATNHRMLEEKGVQVVLGSMTDREGVFDAVVDVDVVFHLAAIQHEANVADSLFRDVNVTGTRYLLDACVAHGVNRLIHGSTIGVYGSIQGQIDETSPCGPDNIYGQSKLEGERLALSFKDRLPVVVIRISETYGPGDRRLLKLFKAVTNPFFFMIGRGRNLHQLIYIDDLIDGFFMAVDSENARGEVIVLAGKEPITTNDMVRVIAASVDATPPRVWLPLYPIWLVGLILETVFRPLGIQPPLHRRRLDFFKKSFSFRLNKSIQLLGFTPRVGFQEGVRRTAGWYKEMRLLNGSRPAEMGEWMDLPKDMPAGQARSIPLTAKFEAFDSFWEAPSNIEKGYDSFGKFYKRNYLRHLTTDRNARILAVSCGYGYLVRILNELGYSRVAGIDSDPQKIRYAQQRGLNCSAQYAFEFLTENTEPFDLIFCEQEINHLTKDEIEQFLLLCRDNLTDSGCLVVHSLNGANPITGPEALAQNFDHFNTLTEYSLKQVLEHTGYRNTQAFPLKLYIFFENPINYIGMAVDWTLNIIFRIAFIFYGKSNKIFSKKIGVVAYK
jgi:nucleoside-diphosphate-sugar epimerase/2-polyprenyl-3-methyl-5-hydroxy-6-metoxy-1,4-benzoquinol methylase